MSQPNHFGSAVAATYDTETTERFSPEHLALESAFLAELASPGRRAVEFAIGTGRIALPLRARGVDVHGIELSADMVAQLRRRPGGAEVPVFMGDMTVTSAGDGFDLAYLVFNTISNVTSQAGQCAVFANAAAQLRPGGHFVIENEVPRIQQIPYGERYTVFEHSDSHIGIDEYDVVTQAFWSHHLSPGPDGSWRQRSIPFRYAWPAELDLMATMAGLRLVQRWAWWDRTPFAATSDSHVSVWRKD